MGRSCPLANAQPLGGKISGKGDDFAKVGVGWIDVATTATLGGKNSGERDEVSQRQRWLHVVERLHGTAPAVRRLVVRHAHRLVADLLSHDVGAPGADDVAPAQIG
jgi:hypothetical protein